MINPDRRYANLPIVDSTHWGLPKDYKAPPNVKQIGLRLKLKRFEAMLQKGAKVQGTVDSLRKQIADLEQATSKSDKNIDLSNLKPESGSDRQTILEETVEKDVNKLQEQQDKKKEKNKKILLYVAVAVAGFFAYKTFFKK